jgi:ubiquinone/menaquinone biosynthesis C-methylase UbiE
MDAETYDTYLVPAIFEPWSRDLIKRAQVWKGDRVLDVACGTGIVATRIAASGAKVTGLDDAPLMLDLAKRRAADEGVGVTWRNASAESLPFRAPEFDLVTCQHGLAFISNRALAAREMRRVIAPGGRAVVTCWAGVDRQPAFKLLDEIATRHLGSGLGVPFSLGDEAALGKLLTDAKFFAIAVEAVTRQVRIPDPARFCGIMLASVSESPDPDALAAATAEAQTALGGFADGDSLAMPTVSLIAVGRVKT